MSKLYKIFTPFIIFFLVFCNSAKAQDKSLLDAGIKFFPPDHWATMEAHRKGDDVFTQKVIYVNPDNNALIIILYSPMSSDKFENSIKTWTERTGTPEQINFLNVPCFIYNYDVALGKTKHKTYNFYKNNNAFMIDFTADAKVFEQYLPDFDKALNSFEITK